MKRIFDALASYGFACILLTLLLILTFLGTLEQTEHGLYDVQKKYFESLFVVNWLWGTVPLVLPGVYLVLMLLFVNLVLGGLVRIRKSRATLGVIVIHVGILLMLAAGFVKMKLSTDGVLTLFPNQRSDEFQSYFESEIAIFDADEKSDVKELIIPTDELGSESAVSTFEHPSLPFRLVVTKFQRNCRALPKGPMWTAVGPTIDGFALKAEPPAKEAELNAAGCYVETEDKTGGAKHEGILCSMSVYPWVVRSGKTWGIDLRKRRFKMPYMLQLDKFTRELHPRTQTAKVFMSDVTVTEPTGFPEKAKIEMNQPLRKKGLVIFQAGWGPEDAAPGQPLFSSFAVVDNPSDQWPLYSCLVIAAGMLITFVQKLLRYVQSSTKLRQT